VLLEKDAAPVTELLLVLLISLGLEIGVDSLEEEEQAQEFVADAARGRSYDNDNWDFIRKTGTSPEMRHEMKECLISLCSCWGALGSVTVFYVSPCREGAAASVWGGEIWQRRLNHD
jgi:hypothetical protein